MPNVVLDKDLELEDISKNRLFAVVEDGRPAGGILRRMLVLANSDGWQDDVFREVGV